MENSENKTTNKSASADREERILAFWKEKNIFEKSLEQTKSGKPFIFYEGPPTANGKPGIHHLEARAFKDAIPRYKTMQRYFLRRKGGWDTHGLPVELQVEKELGFKSKKDIEAYGIAAFNKKCKESVWTYVDLWTKFTDRIGYWVDQEHPYVTYHNNYIESLWNIVSKVNDQGLLYKDYKVVPWCPRDGTALSSHELAQGYQDDKDISVYVEFKLNSSNEAFFRSLGRSAQPDTQKSSIASISFIAWTTTPWTLPGNAALAVNSDVIYSVIEKKDEGVGELVTFILAKERLSNIFENDEYTIIKEIKGSELVGLEYEPLYPYLSEQISGTEKEKMINAYKVYAADFVTTNDGTGILHIAPMYGQDDFELGTKVGLPKFHTVDEAGNFIKGTGFLEGRFVKEVNENGKPTLAVDIIDDLKKRNLFFAQENITHSYPHCWRCNTPLIYYARDSWYIGMSKLRTQLITENEKINWEPAHIKEGRFGEWIKDAKDWAISRERNWGTPLPVRMAEDGEKLLVGSVATPKQ